MGPLVALTLALADPLLAGFQNVPNQDRMRMYWRVFGPAWTPSEIDYELDELKKTGVSGVMVYLMYPIELDNPAKGIKNLKFGSPEFLDSFRYAAHAAQKRGLRFGVNGSTGWPFGGSRITREDSAKKVYETKSEKLGPGEMMISQVGDKKYLVGPTNMQVKRPAFGAEGLVLDHYDSAALDRYLKQVIEPMVKASDGIVKEVGCDSLEVYGSNWARDLPTEFSRRRGYDLVPHLPEFFDLKSESGKGVRFDFWRTLAELTEERFTKPLGAWCGKRGINLEMEPYGTPPNPMTSSRYIQTPVGEHYEWKGFSVQKYVASAAHQAGRRVISSEAWTWTGLPNRLIDSLSDLKLCTDMTLLSGANDLTGVDYPYSPRSAGSPGWTPYYGPFMSPGNPQWPMFPTLVNYVNRCQWMLRQGEPVRDVAVYLPVEDSFREGPVEGMTLDFYVRDRLVTGKATSEFGLANGLKHQSDLVHGLISNGLDYDGVDFWSMNRVARVGSGELSIGSARYKAVVLPHLTAMDLGSMQRLRDFVSSGGTVIASQRLPDIVPGSGPGTEELRSLVASVFGASPPGHSYHQFGRGWAGFARDDAEAARMVRERVLASVRYFRVPTTVGFQHRRSQHVDIYFFANVGPDAVSFPADLMTKFSNIEAWDAMSGKVSKVANREVRINLAPRESVFYVCRNGKSSSQPPSVFKSEGSLFCRGWTLAFEGPDAPRMQAIETPVDWTKFDDAKYFSGIGVYSGSFEISSPAGKSFVLPLRGALGPVRVIVNGKDCGTRITNPFEFDITAAVKPGKNRIDIRVANLPVNRFIGLPKPDLGPLRAVYGNRFPVPDEHNIMKGVPAPSGLEGAVSVEVGRYR